MGTSQYGIWLIYGQNAKSNYSRLLFPIDPHDRLLSSAIPGTQAGRCAPRVPRTARGDPQHAYEARAYERYEEAGYDGGCGYSGQDP